MRRHIPEYLDLPERAEPKQGRAWFNRLRQIEHFEEGRSFYEELNFLDQIAAPVKKGIKPRYLSEYNKKLAKTKAGVRNYVSPGCWAKLSSLDKESWSRFCSDGIQSRGRKIQRRSACSLSVGEFVEEFEKPRIPVILTGLAKNENAAPKIENFNGNQFEASAGVFDPQNLSYRFGSREFDFEESGEGNEVLLDLQTYLLYALRDSENDRNPLYLFDSNFEVSFPELLEEYEVPPYFQEDFLAVMGEEERFQWRWFLVGAPRTGSGVHTDPLETSAWNMLLHGRKRWVLFPPDVPAHLITGQESDSCCKSSTKYGDSDDEMDNDPKYQNQLFGRHEDDVYGWFTQKLDLVKNRILSLNQQSLIDCEFTSSWYDFDQTAGETVFVPHGWWHAVINLETSVAVTHNFCSSTNFEHVWNTVKNEYPEKASIWRKNMAELNGRLALRMK